MRYPKPLTANAKIAVTAISSGVDAPLHCRLDFILNDLREKGFRIVEGQCLRSNSGYVSADAHTRARELMQFLTDPEIEAVIPPYGGELATELLPLLDFEALKSSPPKWILGYSDVSTITCALTASSDFATVHSACLMEMLPKQPDPFTGQILNTLTTAEMGSFEQQSAGFYQNTFPDWESEPYSLFDLSQPTRWQKLKKTTDSDDALQLRGRLFGGCLDTLVNLFENPYLDFTGFKQRYQLDGVILFLENVEMSPKALKRALLSMDMRGVFNHINGLLLGRSTGPEDANGELDYYQIIQEFFMDKDFPVLFDADISHYPPNMTLINGALANIEYSDGHARVTQTLVP